MMKGLKFFWFVNKLVLSALATVLIIGCGAQEPTPTPTPLFSYQIRVQAKETGKGIANAKVTIDVEGKSSLIELTDSEGLARIFVYASHSDRPGRLIVEATGYETYTRNIELIADRLPSAIQLEVAAIPPTPTSPPESNPAGAPADTSQVVPTRPNFPDSGLWVDSYPPGADVYVIPATVDMYNLEIEDVVQPDNFIGTSPVADQLPSGDYYVVTSFSPELFSTYGYQLPVETDPTFDDAFPFDGNLFHNMTFIEGTEIGSISKVYRVDISNRYLTALTSIALPLPEHQRGQPRPTIYPTLATVNAFAPSFTFKETVMQQAIEESLVKNNLASQVEPALVTEMVEVLLRVGKVKLDTGDIDIIIQINEADESFSIITFS